MQKLSLRSKENFNDEGQDKEKNTCIEEMTKSNDKSQIRVWFSYFCLIACIFCWACPVIFSRLMRSRFFLPVMAIGFLFGIGFSTTFKNEKVRKFMLRLCGIELNLSQDQNLKQNQDLKHDFIESN